MSTFEYNSGTQCTITSYTTLFCDFHMENFKCVNVCLRNELTTYAQSNNNNSLVECDCDVIRSQLLLLSGNDLALSSCNVRHFVLPTTELNNSIALLVP